jgi:hypothetical protein
MQFATQKDCLKFFNMSMIEHNHREHMEYNEMCRHAVTVGDQPHVVVTGLCGDIFIFAPVKKPKVTRPVGWKLVIDGAVHDGAGPEPMTKRALALFELAVTKGFTPIAFLACISEHRTCGLAPEEKDDFDEAYLEELDHLQAMLEFLV